MQGWVKGARKQKKQSFLDLGDGTTAKNLQVVVPSQLLPPDLSHHSCVSVTGHLCESSHPKQPVELRATQVTVLGSCEESYPFQARQAASQEFVREHPTCKAKTNSVSSLLRIRNNLSRNIHQYFQERDYLEIHTPILTTNDCEGGGEVFTVQPPQTKEGEAPYWERPVFLTVSGQLHLEAVCNGISRVYTLNPAFRAERGRTTRHLAEFWMLEAELAFVDSLEEVVSEMEGVVTSCAAGLLSSCSEDLELYSRAAGLNSGLERIEQVASAPWHILEYSEAVSLLARHKLSSLRAGDLGREHELWLCEHFGGVVAVVNWPAATKPLYMREVPGSGGELVSAVDILVPRVGELCGGSLREHCPHKLAARLAGVEDNSLDWYLDLRRQGAAPTGGFGLGFDRLVQFLVGVENIKDTVPFHRTPHSCPL